MRRFILTCVVTLGIVTFLLASWVAWGAECSSGSFVCAKYTGPFCISTVSWTAAANGSVTACQPEGLTGTVYGEIYTVETDPGSTAPTADYDITLTDAAGNDVMGGAIGDRSATATERAAPLLTTGVEWPAAFVGPLTVNWSNNSVDSATGTIKIYWMRY